MDHLGLLGYTGALAIGLVLGLTGSGGSLMAVPIFSYLFQLHPVTATGYTLFVVGASALGGTVRNLSKGMIDFRMAVPFALPALIMVYTVRRYLVPRIPEMLWSTKEFVITFEAAIMIGFALLLAIAAIRMIRNGWSQSCGPENFRKTLPKLVLQGTLIGLLTGFVGVGGGFLIIPALVIWARLPMAKAVATSLFIIALKSSIGFLGDLGHADIEWSFLIRFTLLSLIGIWIGLSFSERIDGRKLKKGFAWTMLILAVAILFVEIGEVFRF